MSVKELRSIRKTQEMSTGIMTGEHTEPKQHLNHSLKTEFTQKNALVSLKTCMLLILDCQITH